MMRESNRDHVAGFARLAYLLASDEQDMCFQIYRRLAKLFTRNLVHLQSQIAVLEAQQAQLDEDDKYDKDLSTQHRLKEWEKLDEAAANDPRAGERRKLARAMEERLHAYGTYLPQAIAMSQIANIGKSSMVGGLSEQLILKDLADETGSALLMQSQLLKLRQPLASEHQALVDVFNHSESRSDVESKMLKGASEYLYEDRADLISLANAPDDLVAFLIQEHSPAFLFRTKDQTEYSKTIYLSARRMRWAALVVYIIIAVTLLYGPIIIFYNIRRPRTVVVLVGVFITVFGTAVGLLTPAKLSECFAICAAYAAVLVVFISNPLTS